MNNETYQAQKKLAIRLQRHVRVMVDCIGRLNDMLEESGTDHFELSYCRKQLKFAAESVDMATALVDNYCREHPAELEQREC